MRFGGGEWIGGGSLAEEPGFDDSADFVETAFVEELREGEDQVDVLETFSGRD